MGLNFLTREGDCPSARSRIGDPLRPRPGPVIPLSLRPVPSSRPPKVLTWSVTSRSVLEPPCATLSSFLDFFRNDPSRDLEIWHGNTPLRYASIKPSPAENVLAV